MNDKTKGQDVSAREAASNLFEFLSNTINDDLDLSESELDREIDLRRFDFAAAKKKLIARVEAGDKQAVLKAARAQLNSKKSRVGSEVLFGRTRAIIEAEIVGVRQRLEGRGFAYAMRDYSNQPDEDLEAYLEDLKTLEQQADEGSH